MARHSRMNTDIKPVREIDIENASKDELIEYLCQTIHYEVEKGEGADCDLIRECSDWLGELTADKIVFTPEELDAKLEAIKTGKYINTAKPHKPSHIHHVTKRKVFARVAVDSSFTAEEQADIAECVVNGKEDLSATTYNLWCTMFGHKTTTESFTIIEHCVSATAPRCVESLQDVTACSRCDYVTTDIISSNYIFCCD